MTTAQPAAGGQSTGGGGAREVVGVKVRLPADTLAQVRYWAARQELSANELVVQAVEHWLATRNQNYDLPVLEVQRLNQLVDQVLSLATNVHNLELVVYDGLGSLLALARGDDYLLSLDTEVV